MSDDSNTTILPSTLTGAAARVNDPDTRARERLRAAFLRMREQAAVIAGEIGLTSPSSRFTTSPTSTPCGRWPTSCWGTSGC